MLVALIVVPAIIVAVAVVLLLDRTGVLPRMDGGPSHRSDSGFLESLPKAALFASGVVMALWILAWLVFLVIGLAVLAG